MCCTALICKRQPATTEGYYARRSGAAKLRCGNSVAGNICNMEKNRREAGNVTAGSQTVSFVIHDGVKLYGGYAGPVTNPLDPDQRDVAANETILNGDLAGNDPSRSENSYHIITGTNQEPNAIIDGVTVYGGFANGVSGYDNTGGGLRDCDAMIRNCRITQNFSYSNGGGLYDCNGLIIGCVIENNKTSLGEGAGLFDCDGVITNCLIIGNRSIAGHGAGMALCDMFINNCTVANNRVGNLESGGGM